MMLLYLRHGTMYRIDTIELIDGCYPRITYDVVAFGGNDGVRSPPPTEEFSASELKLEPALWGIILILDRVVIDIARRRFSWATESAGKILDQDGSEDLSCVTHCADDERYEYDDNLDELFNLAAQLMAISHSRTKSIRESHEEQSCLIRMLYCCILPKIQIYQKDQEKVENAIDKQMTCIAKINNDIEQDMQRMTELNNVLYKQQDERLHEFICIALEKKCTKSFVMVLINDLRRRTETLSELIGKNQDLVQVIKKDICENGETEEKKRKLDEARKVSAHLNKMVKRILKANNDTLKETFETGNFALNDNETVVQDYVKSKEMYANQKLKARNHTEKKVQAISILENLKRIKDDITQDEGVASANTTSISGKRSTDIIDGDIHVPEYQTLSERVAAIANNPEHPLGGEFAQFTKYIRESCLEILEDVELSASSNKQKRNTSMWENGYLLIDNDGHLQKEYLSHLENLSSKMKLHFDHMGQLFLEQFSSHYEVLKRKLQLCYEENVYNEVGADIKKVYEMAYKSHKKKMIEELIQLSTYPISCLDLGMKDEWWLKLFENRRQASVARNRQRSENSSLPYNSMVSAPPKSDSSSTECEKGSTSKIQDYFLKFIRRKSNEVTKGDKKNRNGMIGKTSCYDNYHGEAKPTPVAHNGFHDNDHPSTKENSKPVSRSFDQNGTKTMNMHCESEESNKNKTLNDENELSMFAKYFGPCLNCLKDVLKVPSVFGKLKCLTNALTTVTESVHELRQQVLQKVDDDTRYSLAITADDLLPLMVLIMLQMEPEDAASIVVDLRMMDDLIPRFLSAGCHGYALVEFDMASNVLQSLCMQFDCSMSGS